MKSEVRNLNIKLRKENYEDYKMIAEINALAFSSNGYIGEVALVDSLRHCDDFDRELSLVAEVNGKVVGHALFYPFDTVINNTIIKTVYLAPLAIHPDYQNCGIGGMLVNEGHKIAKKKGYKFAFLHGHFNYYPRFGYKTHMFGECSIEILSSSINLEPAIIEEREVRLNDIEVLMKMWKSWHGNIDLALVPRRSILDWISHTVKIKTSVITINGEVKGYLRYDTNDARDIKMFLAEDKESAEQLVRYIANKIDYKENVRLPIHPDSLAISMLSSFQYKVDIQKWDAGMIRILDEKCTEIIEYCDEVLAEKRKPGKMIFIPSYDMA